MFTFLTCVFNALKMMHLKDFEKLKPILVVLGATGTGKSKLALELAMKYNGEVISADSMQIYKGLDIVTNKVTESELQLVPHHLIGFVESHSNYTVVDFQRDSLSIIDKLHSAGKLPVIVGGTHYYIESILWNVLVGSGSQNNSVPSDDKSAVLGCKSEKSAHSSECESDSVTKYNKGGVKSEVLCDSVQNSISDRAQYASLSNEELFTKLENVDPEYAATLHPNNRRKIIRSLEVWETTGRRHSDILNSMRQTDGGDAFGGGKRFSNVALLWLTCDQDVLKDRLFSRVDEMISAGLLDELRDFHSQFNAPLLAKQEGAASSGPQPETAKEDIVDDHYQKGIFQSIGFKEFHDYLMLSAEERESPRGQKIYQSSLRLMKQRTFRYSKKQIKWIRNRLLIRDRKSFPVYALDATDPSKWTECVSKPAYSIVESLLAEKEPAIAPAAVDFTPKMDLVTGDKSRHHCDICDRIFIGDLQWKEHLESAKHRNMCKKRQRADLEAGVTEEENKTKV